MTDADELIECARCARHAFARDARCPFCAAVLPEAVPDRPRWIGPLTRAAVFYGASALATVGCGEPEPASTSAPAIVEAPIEPVAVAEPPSEVAPPETDPVASRAVVAEAPAAPAFNDEEERAHAESGKRRLREREQRAAALRRIRDLRQIRHAMPYGAPPFDFVV